MAKVGRSGARTSYIAGVSLGSLLLMGFYGVSDCGPSSRYRTVSSRTAQVTITGYADTVEWIGAYQQSSNPSVANYRGAAYPDVNNGFTDGCGDTWYPWTMSIYLNGGDNYWFTNGAQVEQAQVLLRTYYTGHVLYTTTGDSDFGPSNANACGRSYMAENSKLLPLVYFHGSVPADLDCSSGDKSFLGCPYTCNLILGCDTSYGTTQNLFYLSAYRSNLNNQSTASIRFDNYGYNGSVGAPPGDWTYQYETGICIGGTYNGQACDNDGNCTGGYCNESWVVKRRNSFTSDSLNIRRGENRRNVYVEGWAKNKYNDYYNREIGLVTRFYDNNNYFMFMVREYGGDYARLQRRANGAYATLAYAYPSFTLTSWTKLGFKVIDTGSWNDTQFIPNGNCYMAGYINGNIVVYNSSTGCSQNPYGQYGLFSYYNSNSQFWNLDAHACNPYNLGCY